MAYEGDQGAQADRGSNDDVYALTAYLLYMNEVFGEADTMDARSRPQVRMPNCDNLFPEVPKLAPSRR